MEQYQKFGTIKRTILTARPYWLVDWQALPPMGWCVVCGREVYGPGEEKCGRCEKELRIEN